MKRICVLIIMALTTAGAYAQQLSEQEAMERALQYLSSGKTSVSAPGRDAGIRLEYTPVDVESVYAFNMEGGGFIIASADSRTLPVLGYSTTGTIDWEKMPDNMRSWLKSYDEAVASLGNTTDFVDGNPIGEGLLNGADVEKEHLPVEPLIKTHWDQFAPYWDQTPLYAGPLANMKGKRCLTGCLATAMAQIMNYYQWPKSLPDGLPDYDSGDDNENLNYKYHIDALPPVAFDWDNMLNDYELFNLETRTVEELGTEQQRRAVATLMRYCGQALEMMYGTSEMSSQAYFKLTGKAYNRMNYPAALWLTREKYSISEWEDIIYDELAAGRPVQYGGVSDTGGHGFVCDGYDGNGYFHINWGWSGFFDGYYALSVLKPVNANGESFGGIGYCIFENACIYIDPMMEEKPLPKNSWEDYTDFYQFDDIEIDSNTVCVSFYYRGEKPDEAAADIALGTIGDEGKWIPLFTSFYDDSILNEVNYSYLEIDSTIFQPGDTIELYPLLRYRKADAEWQVLPPVESHVVTGCTDEGDFFITVNRLSCLIECESGSITDGTGRLGETNFITVVLNNYSEVDYQSELFLLPIYYGHIDSTEITGETPGITGGMMNGCAYVKAGHKSEVNFQFIPTQGGLTDFYLYNSKKYYCGKFTLELTNDTLAGYDDYVENRSYLSRQGDKYYYNVELCDVRDKTMARWIPSDSIGLKVRFTIDDNVIDSLFIRDEIREYLDSLPYMIGGGNYTFSLQVPIEFERDGVYVISSCIGEWIDNTVTSVSCTHFVSYDFKNPTIVMPTVIEQAEEPYYDLLGRPIEGIPDRKGLYIKGKKKFVVIE